MPKSNNTQYIYLTLIISFSFMLSPLFSDSYASNAISQVNESSNTKTTVFGCEPTPNPGVLHCDPFRSEFESNTTTYTSNKISDITREPIYVDGKDGKAIHFIDLYREYVEIPQSELFNSSEITVSFWMKETDRDKPHVDQNVQESPNAHVISHTNIDGDNGWYFDYNYDDQSVHFVVTDTSGGLTTSDSIPVSNASFTQIAATFDGSQIGIYRDGELLQTLSYSGNYSAAHPLPIHIGSASHCNSCNELSGNVDDVQLFNRALSEDEVKQIYLEMENGETQVSNSNSPTGLVGHWSFDNTLDDLSIHKNNAKMFTLLSSLATTPDDRILISEKNTGKIRIIQGGILLERPFAVINDSYIGWEQGLLGIVVDPDFKENHYVYLYYTSTSGEGSNPVNKVIRFTEKDNIAVNSTVIIDGLPAGIGYHSGGAMAFGPDGKLYITVGDATEEEKTQDISSLLGKVLRINKDGSIPADNPFPDSPIFTIGHRNMYGIAFDHKDGIGIVTENGDELYDEINILKKGGNYGYPTYQLPNTPPELSESNWDIKPLRAYLYPQGPTQAIYYDHDKFPSLKDNFIFGTYTGDIYGIHINETSETIDSERRILLDHYPFEAINGIAQTSDGNIFFGAHHLYMLNSISEEDDIVQELFPITITRPINIDIDKVYASINASVELQMSSTPSDSESNNTQYVKIKMPKAIINKIENVVYGSLSERENSQGIPFYVADIDAKYIEITIPLEFNVSNTRLTINSEDIGVT